nr:PREDICTED: cytochrome P450 4V2-like [Bemisia tabaci]
MCEIPHVLTSDPEAISAILASAKNTDKFSHHKCIKTEYPAIVSAQGDEWRNMRKLVNPTFCISNFKVFERNFQCRTNEFLNKLDKHATGEEFDIHLPVHLCTLDLVCDNMIGCKMDVQKNNLEYLSIAMSRAIEMMFERAFQPIFWPDFTYLLSGQQTSFRRTYNPGLDFVKMGIEQRMKARREGAVATESEENCRSFLDILLDNFEAGIISMKQVTAEISEMYFAGSITTANTTAWVFKLLAMFPEVQERVCKEIDEKCDGEQVTPEDLHKLVYLEMVIKETLRHYGPPFTGRKITEDLKVNENLTIPAGIEVFMFLYLMHHDPEYWQKPNKFYPEHFSPDLESKRPKGAFVPFLSGPRVCPGYKYAMRSMKLIIANTLLHYTFSSTEKPPENMTDLEFRILFMPVPVNGLRVKIQRREWHNV